MIRTLLLVPVLALGLVACQNGPDPLADHVKCSDFAGMSTTDQSILASFQLKLNNKPDTPTNETGLMDAVMAACLKQPGGDAQAIAYGLLQN